MTPNQSWFNPKILKIFRIPLSKWVAPLTISLFLASYSILADTLRPEDVPPPLQPWVQWVLHDTQSTTCPIQNNHKADVTFSKKVNQNRPKGYCQWPSRLTLNIDANGAKLTQQWQVYSADWITLPGNTQHWPQSVRLNNQTAIVTDRNGLPSVFAPKGMVTIEGQFQWEQRPEYITIPAHTGLVELTIDQIPVLIPELDSQGRLWLTKHGTTDQAHSEKNALDLHIYRHIIDDIPLQMSSRIKLKVAGRHREIVLGPVTLDKHIPMLLDSPLPARIETDGRLRVQVRPGTWTITLHTRQKGPVNQLTLAQPEQSDSKTQWVDEEIWVFEARNNLRLIEITGVESIDPQQTAIPTEWRQFPTYLVRAGDTLMIEEKRRGNPEPAPDQLELERHYWLDFDGKGYSVQDHIRGTMTRGWRLEMAEPAILGRVTVNGQNQFITRLKKDSDTGVEVRRGQIDLIADSRLETAVTKLPTVGWTHDFQQLGATLHLPPGWRLFNANGADHVSGTWLKQWTLFDLFIVLIIAAAVSKLWRWWWGALTLVTMVLIYHESSNSPWIGFWLINLIAALALLRVLPTLGWFSRLVRSYRNVSIIALLIIVLPFMIQQARQSIYPQLERPWESLEKAEVGASNYNEYDNLAVMDEPSSIVQKPMLASKPLGREFAPYSPTESLQMAKRQQPLQLDPNAQVQTGPGLPQWEWQGIDMTWNGPVQANHTIELWLLSPTVNTLLGALRVILLTILTVFFILASWSQGARLLFKPKGFFPAQPKSQSANSLPSVTLLVLAMLLCQPLVSSAEISLNQSLSTAKTARTLTAASNYPVFISAETSPNPPPSNPPKKSPTPTESETDTTTNRLPDNTKKLAYDSFPPQSLLNELQQRLTALPDCLPHCASSPRLLLELGTTQLHARIEVHSAADIAIPLPGSATQWLPQQVWLNGEPAQALLLTKNGQLWISVSKGIHQIQIEGTLPNRNTIQLPLPLQPHRVEIVKTEGWRVEGLHENGVADNLLQFSREQADEQLAELEMGSLPAFVQIERTLSLGLDWQVETRVRRQTPLGTAIVLEIPLLNGESVNNEFIRVQDNKAQIHLSPNQAEIRWLSVFDKQDTLQLTAPYTTESSEVWRLDASALWHVTVEGIPVVHHQAQGKWLPEWRPWPGESVTLHISQPKGVDGQVLTIDRSQLIVTPGQHSTDSRLILNLRSSRGMQHKLTLPFDAILQSVTINGKTQPIRQQGRFVTLPITPGAQRIGLQFQQPQGIGQYFYTPSVSLGVDSVNTLIEVNMPSERWILFVGGQPIGPAVMIWGILIVIALAAVGLSQIPLTPLKFHHWLLLGVVLSQVAVPYMLGVIGWLIALGWRAQQKTTDWPVLKFNATQIGLSLLTIVALMTLLFAIKQGLLGQPDMHIAGNGSTSGQLLWYQDRSPDTLPSVWVFSLTLWIYRIAMLLWALWLSFALLNWLRWGWQSFSTNGLWKKSLQPKKSDA